jgi:hypothetical protein
MNNIASVGSEGVTIQISVSCVLCSCKYDTLHGSPMNMLRNYGNSLLPRILDNLKSLQFSASVKLKNASCTQLRQN